MTVILGGYAPFDQKFGTLLEQAIDRPVFKCGVTHTGQRHQFLKLVEIEKEFGRSPSVVLVYWYMNDIANDHYFPHSTVVLGWQVDNVTFDAEGNAIPIDTDTLTAQVEDRIKRANEPPPPRRQSLRRQAANYSLTWNLVEWGLTRLRHPAVSEQSPTSVLPPDRRGVYDVEIERHGRLWYADNPMAMENKQALLDLQSHSASLGSEFAVVLIPPRKQVTNSQWHSEVHQFLNDHRIRYFDLADEFKNIAANADTVFLLDGHFNGYGNRVVATATQRVFSDILTIGTQPAR